MQFRKVLTHGALALLLTTTTMMPLVQAAPRDVSASTSVELRVEYLEKLLQSRTGLRLKEHQQGAVTEISQQLSKARTALAKGDSAQANQQVREGLRRLMIATKALPPDPEESRRHQARYENLLQGLRKFSFAETDNKERFNISENGNGDNQARIAKLVKAAEVAAAKGLYEIAASHLQEAQVVVTASLQSMLNHKQLVNELDISTPEKEYYYELRRYLGYEELIPVALDVKKPELAIADQMQQLGKKARWMTEQAQQKAIAKEYPIAIRMMMDATDVVRQALGMAGVTM